MVCVLLEKEQRLRLDLKFVISMYNVLYVWCHKSIKQKYFKIEINQAKSIYFTFGTDWPDKHKNELDIDYSSVCWFCFFFVF